MLTKLIILRKIENQLFSRFFITLADKYAGFLLTNRLKYTYLLQKTMLLFPSVWKNVDPFLKGGKNIFFTQLSHIVVV